MQCFFFYFADLLGIFPLWEVDSMFFQSTDTSVLHFRIILFCSHLDKTQQTNVDHKVRINFVYELSSHRLPFTLKTENQKTSLGIALVTIKTLCTIKLFFAKLLLLCGITFRQFYFQCCQLEKCSLLLKL